MSFARGSVNGRYGCSVVERRWECVGDRSSVVSIGESAGLDLLFKNEEITDCAEDEL